jgi:hypothetical protein
MESRGFPRFNLRHNISKMRACDIDYCVLGKTRGIDLILIESKNRDEQHRFTTLFSMSRMRHYSGGKIRAYIFLTTTHASWDERADMEEDWTNIEVCELVDQPEDEIYNGIFRRDEIKMPTEKIKWLAQGRVPFENEIERVEKNPIIFDQYKVR